ncbi:hypothetical protein ACFSBG_16800 [Georgenia yuyongxinii]|uniref:hypothetical protein n=1 Tax=Georgenia yuyongxinii TaxID=2589797 RepID=UPI00143DF583|nr:hypothetical protein [Georgenia yuyongxinii]
MQALSELARVEELRIIDVVWQFNVGTVPGKTAREVDGALNYDVQENPDDGEGDAS